MNSRIAISLCVSFAALAPAPFDLQAQSSTAGVGASSATVVQSVRRAELTFFDVWRQHFVDSRSDPATFRSFARERSVIPPGFDPTTPVGLYGPKRVDRPHPPYDRAMNTPYLFCRDHDLPWHHMGALSPTVTEIFSTSGGRGWCPSWSWTQDHADAQMVVDSLLPLERRRIVREQRDHLIALLDSASRSQPGDDFLAGQFVRMLVEQQRTSEARSAAAQCNATTWWCEMLRGFASARDGDNASAARHFTLLRSQLSDTARCVWEDISALLERSDQRTYARLPCAVRDTVHEKFWWLSDPLWFDDINERRVEHYARRVDVLLRRALVRDELFNWTAEQGSDATEQMLIRYGMPSKRAYDSSSQKGIDAVLRRKKAALSRPYTTAEYRRSRTHTAPPLSLTLNPFAARADDWTLHEPDLSSQTDSTPSEEKRGFKFLDLELPQLEKVWPHRRLWWPAEHFEPRRPLVQMQTPQVAMLRRQDDVEIAVALEASDPLHHNDAQYGFLPRAQRGRDTLQVHLMSSRAPQDIHRIANRIVVAGNTVALSGRMRSETTVLALEVGSVSESGGDARQRFAIVPPAPLRSLTSNAIAISEPVFLNATNSTAHMDSLPAILERMRGTNTLPSDQRLGLYWEVYGARTNDTLELAIRVVNDDAPGIARRIGAILAISGNSRDNVGISWLEARTPSVAIVVPSGGVPIVGRVLTVDVSALNPGTYWVEVYASRLGELGVHSRKRIEILRPAK